MFFNRRLPHKLEPLMVKTNLAKLILCGLYRAI